MKIALGVSGGIAAYKAAEIVRLLQDRGVRVQVIMTAAAQEFVRPLTFAALSGEKVITSMFGSAADQPNLDSAVEHISVAQSIDALLVAPATADTIAKFAQGIAEVDSEHTSSKYYHGEAVFGVFSDPSRIVQVAKREDPFSIDTAYRRDE